MKRTVIHLLCHTLINDKDLKYYVFGGFGARQIRGVRKYIKEFNYEVWYAVAGLKQKKLFKKEGIIYKLFPAQTFNKTLESYLPIISSPLLFAELLKYDPKRTLIHFQGERGTLLHYLLFKYSQYPVVLQYHGYGQPRRLDWLEWMFILPFERINFPKIKHFFVPIKPRVRYLTDSVQIRRNKISTENIGIDFDLFKPSDQNIARKKLDLPNNSFVLLYVGHLMKSKGADKIFEAYQALKKKYRKLFLLVVGSLENDPLYPKLLPIADRVVHFVSNTQMPDYLNAADVLCFYGNEKNIRFAGPGIAPTEALACNTNVISTNLYHFESKIVNKIGFIPKSYQDLSKKIEFLINHPRYKIDTRRIIAPYVSFKGISSAIKKVYDASLT